MAGSIGGMFVATGAGWVLQTTGRYWPLFIAAGSAYLVALALIHLLVPKLEAARV
jgi:ACS family hexuronate transporter-like MFS transporter